MLIPKTAQKARKDANTTIIETATKITVGIAILLAGFLIGEFTARAFCNDARNEAKCTSIYGVYGGGKCYVHGEEQQL